MITYINSFVVVKLVVYGYFLYLAHKGSTNIDRHAWIFVLSLADKGSTNNIHRICLICMTIFDFGRQREHQYRSTGRRVLILCLICMAIFCLWQTKHQREHQHTQKEEY